jgi:hypothetical protein
MLEQVMSGYFRLAQVRPDMSCKARLSQARSGKARLRQTRSD